MFVIPFQINDKEFALLVCLEDKNLERIRAYDPAEVNLSRMNGIVKWQGLQLRDVIIAYATDADFDRMQEMLAAQAPIADVLRFFTRGYRYRPEEGDRDGLYVSISPEDEVKPGEIQ